MPREDPSLIPDLENRLIHDEMNYNRGVLDEEHSCLMSTMTDEQQQVYDKIMSRVNANTPDLFIVTSLYFHMDNYMFLSQELHPEKD
ncbi:hypothetical protein MtrunA17_Chr3g0096361 [Medicago truncatula]|uniref:Uncharacterized protein n=1 Tax=Medicago truncatula TaxID=3880 RepID=A0A396IQ55_MEDTR|nr:hypothetical protein MtrunA17_Chr3g0096361 [Medicago truncatula]